MILAVALTVALGLGLAGSTTWPPSQPSGHPAPRALRQGAVPPPAGVITQAHARQRRRHRRIAATAATAGAEVAARVAGVGSPGRSRPARPHHDDHSGAPVPPARAETLSGLPANSNPNIAGLSCPSAGNCSLDGTYSDGSGSGGSTEMFVASEVQGRWGGAGTIDFPARSIDGGVVPLACSSAGNCLLAGNYSSPGSDQYEDFIVVENDGTWGPLQQIPSLPQHDALGNRVDAVSCASAGNCAAGGAYTVSAPGHRTTVPFIATETNGRWGNAQPIGGVPNASISDISCASAGNCTAEGTYSKNSTGVFVVSENNGKLGTAEPLRGLAGRAFAATYAQISCAAAGDCGLIGYNVYPNLATRQAFVASEVNGTWGSTELIPGVESDNALAGGVSCPAPGDCTAAGLYDTRNGYSHSFTVTQTDGTWHDAREVPGIPAISRFGGVPGGASFGSISCAAAGDCLIGGSVATTIAQHAATATEADGTWRDAEDVPGLPSLRRESALVSAISCSRGGPCVSAGVYGSQPVAGSQPGPVRIFVIS